MSEHDKDNLSRFFQKAVKNPDIEFNENDWTQLEAMLDEESARAVPRLQPTRKIILFSVIALVVIGTASLFVFNMNQSIEKKEMTNSVISEKKNPVVKDSSKESRQALASEQINQLPISSAGNEAHADNSTTLSGQRSKRDVLKNTGEELKMNSLSLSVPFNKESDASDPHEEALYLNKKVHQGNATNNFPSRNEQIETVVSGPVNKTTPNQSDVETNNTGLLYSTDKLTIAKREDGNGISEERSTLALNKKSSNERSMQNDSSIVNKDSIAIDRSKKTKIVSADSVVEKDDKPASISRWSIMLSASPDFSSMGFGKFSAPGKALGIAVYYHLNQTLSISAGATLSDKRYWNYGSEIHPPEGYWKKRTNGIIPDEVTGACSVLEIPVGVLYNVITTPRNKVYVAANISSCIMLKESYSYTFDAPNPGSAEGWDTNKTSYSLWSGANIALGYERNISSQLAIGVSPYAKIPMKGIGDWAYIKLYSLGASFTLRYTFHKKKNLLIGVPGRSPD